MKKKLITSVSALLLAIGISIPSVSAAGTVEFSDVPDSKHFAEAVYDLAGRNIIGGYIDGTFRPENPITRGQAAAIISKLIELDTRHVKNPEFKDVSKASGYYAPIAALAEQKIISGYPDGRYGPNDPITRGQMASILVKAFNLPRYSFQEERNPFTDITQTGSHGKNVLILYRLGITTGTTPSTYGPNAAITRGQAAKLMQITEDAKAPIKTLSAKDFGWNEFTWSANYDNDTKPFNAVVSSTMPEKYAMNQVQIVPLREGTGTLNFGIGQVDPKNYKKYYVHVKEVGGKLQTTLEETSDFLPTELKLGNKEGKAQSVSLYTMDGKLLEEQMEHKPCVNGMPGSVCISIKEPGRYIATVQYAEEDDNMRYGMIVESVPSQFTFSARILEEKKTAVVDLGDSEKIGTYTIDPKAEEIATVTREKGTNRFVVTGKKKGSFDITFQGKTSLPKGINVSVEQVGNILHVHASLDYGDVW